MQWHDNVLKLLPCSNIVFINTLDSAYGFTSFFTYEMIKGSGFIHRMIFKIFTYMHVVVNIVKHFNSPTALHTVLINVYKYKCIYYSAHTWFQLCCQFKRVFRIHNPVSYNSIMC
jgi:hypothetical protein